MEMFARRHFEKFLEEFVTFYVFCNTLAAILLSTIAVCLTCCYGNVCSKTFREISGRICYVSRWEFFVTYLHNYSKFYLVAAKTKDCKFK